MRYFKDQSNEIYAYDDSQQPISGLIEITQQEADSIRQSKKDAVTAAKSYAEKRVAEYPSIGDQLDALFHAGAFPADMAAKIQAVKDKYPKS